MADETEEQLQLRAEIFRSKLIEHFHLLDNMSEISAEEVPKYYSDELKHDASIDNMMRTFPNALVKFDTYSKTEDMIYRDKRLNRIKTKNTIPMGPWAKMVVEDSKVQNFLLILIISNSIVLGIQAEISQTPKESLQGLKVFLNIFDYLSLMVFVLEILLKWIDGFVVFWRNGWNVFDFLVTIMSFVPELIRLSPGQNANQGVKLIADNLRTFRILRSLKMVSRFAQLRIIVLTILKALKSMAFILMLLATFMYIFAVTGTVMFAAHANSERSDVKYKSSFSNLVNSLLTLFQLFTLDHWFEILVDLGKEANSLFSKVYIILWICVGSFIFKNVFTGIMVMNFQNIRNDFIMQCKEHEQAMKEEEQKTKLEKELAKQYRSHSFSARRKSSLITGLLDPNSSFMGAKIGDLIEEEDENEPVDEETDNNAEKLDKAGPVTVTVDAEPSNSSVATGLSKIEERKHEEEHQTTSTNPGANDSGVDAIKEEPRVSDSSADHKQTSPYIQLPEEFNDSNGGRSYDAEDPPCGSKVAWGTSVLENLELPGLEEDLKTESNNTKEYKGSSVWNNTVTANLPNLKSNSVETLWPRDSLFDYFQLMEALQDNLAERHQLQKLAVIALNQIHDGNLQ